MPNRYQIWRRGQSGISAPSVLAVSASYEARTESSATSFDLPIVRLSMPDLASSHWSQSKQSALAQQLFDAARQLEARGVTLIHLVLAAQDSVAFNLGRRYDKRNLPNLIVSPTCSTTLVTAGQAYRRFFVASEPLSRACSCLFVLVEMWRSAVTLLQEINMFGNKADCHVISLDLSRGISAIYADQ
ncbi:SAVED domain-containing protein [Rhizobium leguminosarum]|nr:SAVED domain-containing protein [Rhizobium leguminosarum]